MAGKTTGEAGSKTDLILRAQRIKLSIYQRQSIWSAGNGIGNSFDGEDDLGEGFDDDDLDEDEGTEHAGADEDQLFGTQYQATKHKLLLHTKEVPHLLSYPMVPMSHPNKPREINALAHKRFHKIKHKI